MSRTPDGVPENSPGSKTPGLFVLTRTLEGCQMPHEVLDAASTIQA